MPTFDAYLDAVRKIRKLSDIAAIVGLWWCAARSCKTKAEKEKEKEIERK